MHKMMYLFYKVKIIRYTVTTLPFIQLYEVSIIGLRFQSTFFSFIIFLVNEFYALSDIYCS